MKGMKVRVPASKIYIDTLSAMGASPSGLPFGETFSAVQQGVVDGLDGSIATIYGTKVYEVAKKVAMTQHILGSLGVYISPQSWAKLPPELQEIVQEEFDKGAIENNQTLYRLEQEYMKELVQDHGMTFTEVNLDEFGEMTKGVYDRFPGWSKGVRDTMLAEIKKLHESGEVAKAQAIMEGSNE
jgi:TRAP-type C4-dicarboxylate transport system substrate-binding protein